MRQAFGDDWHGAKTLPTELAELSAEELAELTVNVLWPPAPPSPEERAARAREAMTRIYAEVVAEREGV